eukprot:Selendium_serpulae@DN1504_c0_g1_i1.p1
MVQTHLRFDGRSPDQIRPPGIEFEVVKRSDGSCAFSMGRTEVYAAVYGPVETNLQKKTLMTRAFVDVLVRPFSGTVGQAERMMETILRSSFSDVIQTHMFPRMLITLILQPICDDGGLFACAFNAGMVALLEAGIPCSSTWLALNIGLMPAPVLDQPGLSVDCDDSKKSNSKSIGCTSPGHDIIILDPVAEEMVHCESVVALGFNICQSQSLILSVPLKGGGFTKQAWDATLIRATAACTILEGTLRRAMQERFEAIEHTLSQNAKPKHEHVV